MKRTRENEKAMPIKKFKTLPETVQGPRPMYRFFLIWKRKDGATQEIPARCLLDWGSTTFAIAAKMCEAFDIPTTQREKAWASYNVAGRKFEDGGKTRTHPLRLAFGNHCSDEVMEVMTLGRNMDVIIPYWWMAKHKCTGVYEGTLRFNECPDSCFHALAPDWSITYDRGLVTEEGVFTI